MNEPVVSVVMVIRNVDRFLAQAIESILNQTFRDLEFVIVDFGSTDNSSAIVSEYAAKDSRIRFHTIPACGLAEARNAACSLARGRYIAIMDADDVSLPNRLTCQVEFMVKHPEVGVVGGAVEWIDATGLPLETYGHPVENREIQLALISYCPLWQPSVLVRREAFLLVGGYRPAFAPAEDYDLWLRIAEHFEIANLERTVLQYRIHPGQVSLRKQKDQTLGTLAAQASAASRRSGSPDRFDSLEELSPAILAALGVSEARQQFVLANKYLEWIRTMCRASEWSAALSAAVEMLQASDWKYLEKRLVADMRIVAARLYWKNNQFLQSIVTASRAIITRPMVAGRPLKPLLRRFRLVG